MKRLYIVPLATHLENINRFHPNTTTHWMSLYDPAEDGAKEAWEAAGSHVVVAAEFSNETNQDHWESLPDVKVLPHPVFDGNMPLVEAYTLPENGMEDVTLAKTSTESVAVPKLSKFHHHMTRVGLLNVTDSDTVLDVHRKLAKWHPGFRLKGL